MRLQNKMRLDQAELPGNILKVRLSGPLDIVAPPKSTMPFSIIAGKHNKVIVDFTDVTFLASIGIRVVVKTARAINNRKGALVIFNASDDARKVLRSTGVDTIVAVVADEGTAIAACSG